MSRLIPTGSGAIPCRLGKIARTRRTITARLTKRCSGDLRGATLLASPPTNRGVRARYRLRVDIEQIAPRLWWWTASHPEWSPEDLEEGKGWEQVVSSYAHLAGETLVLFDPLIEHWDPLDRLVDEHGAPSVLITILWHTRSSQELLDRYGGASLWAYERAADWVGERARVTNTFAPGDDLPGGVEAISMRRIEEVAYRLPDHNAVVIGDTILRHGDLAEPVHRPGCGRARRSRPRSRRCDC